MSGNEIIGLDKIYKILPLGAGEILSLIHSHELPVVEVGETYIKTKGKLIQWVEENIGQQVLC